MSRPATAAVRLLTGEREPVRMATTANISLSGLQTVDGVLTKVGDRVLVKDQTNGTLNGIYTASAGTWYRASDARSSREIQKGTTVHVQVGTVNSDRVFSFTADEPVIGTSSITIVPFLPPDIDGIVEATQTARDDAEIASALAQDWAVKATDITSGNPSSKTSAATSTAAAAAAVIAKTAAETAAASVGTNLNVYADIATGRAAVADGAQFMVVSGDDIIRYRRDSASTQTEMARYPTAASVSAKVGWERLQSHEASLALTSATEKAGRIIFIDPMPETKRVRLKVMGNATGGSIFPGLYSRVDQDFQIVTELASVAIAANVENTVDLGVVPVGSLIGYRPASGNVVAFVARGTNEVIRSGGYVQAGTGTGPSTETIIFTDTEPQVAIEVIPVLAEDAAKAVTTPVTFAGRSVFLDKGTSTPGPTGRTLIYQTASPQTGKLRVWIFGAGVDGVARVRSYTKSGSAFSKKSQDYNISIKAGKLNVFTLPLVIYAGEYFGISHAADTIAYEGATTSPYSTHIRGGPCYGLDTPTFTNDYMVRADVIPLVPYVRTPTSVLLGDSIPARGGIVDAAAQLLGENIINGAIGGTRLSRTGGSANYVALSGVALSEAIRDSNWTAPLAAATAIGATELAAITALSTVDYLQVKRLIVWLSTNDFGNNVVIGSTGSTTNTELMGAINAIDANIRATYPLMDIVHLTPIWRYTNDSGGHVDSDTNPNSIGKYLTDYVDAIISECGKRRNPVIDLFRAAGINKTNAYLTIPDDTHPSYKETKDRLGRLIGSRLKSFGSY